MDEEVGLGGVKGVAKGVSTNNGCTVTMRSDGLSKSMSQKKIYLQHSVNIN